MVVDYFAGWCKPCKVIAPTFGDLARQYGQDAKFVKVDIDEIPEAFDGTSIPTFHVSFEYGKTFKYSQSASGPIGLFSSVRHGYSKNMVRVSERQGSKSLE